MFIPQDPLTSLHCLLLQSHCILPPTEIAICRCEVVHAPQCIRMFIPQDPPLSLQHLLLQSRCILPPTEIAICQCEVIHARQCPRILCSEFMSIYFNCNLLKLLGVVEFTVKSEKASH